MRKNEKMRTETVRKQLDKKIENGDMLCALTMIRMSRGMTQVERAERTGLTQPYIARIERGERDLRNVTMLNGYKLSQALGCRMEDLI